MPRTPSTPRIDWKQEIPLPSFSSTKEASGFSSPVFRWIWQFYTGRLTQAGRWFFWASVGFLAYSTTSLEFQSYIAFLFVLAVWTVALAAMMLCRPRFELHAEHSDRVCAGETLNIDLALTALSTPPYSDFHVAPHRLPEQLDASPHEGRPVPAMVRGQRVRTTLGLSCRERGVFNVPAFRVETDFPFGLLRAHQTFSHDQKLMVYPKFAPLTRLTIPIGRRYQPGGVAMISVSGDSMEFIGNREYREGDNVRDIDWTATARLGKPIVREYREEYFLRVALILDTHIPSGASAGRRRAMEHAISIAASVGDYLSRQEYVIDIFAAGPDLYHLIAGPGLAYLDQVLDILCCIRESPTEPFGIIASELMNHLARISTVICVFLDWNETRRQFVRSLTEQGVGILAVVVCEHACELDPAADGVRVLSPDQIERGVAEL